LAAHHEEQEQIDELKRWWQENRTFVVAGLVIGVTTVAGWRGWEWHATRQAEAAAAVYAELDAAIAAGDATTAAARAATLAADYARTPYAANGALLQAKALVEAGDLAQARRQLEWAAMRAGDAELAELARIRLARVELSAGDGAAALAALAATRGGAFAALIEEVRGDAHRALGQETEARAAYAAALAAADDNPGDRQMLELKLADLGPAPAAAVATLAPPAPDPGAKP